MEKQIFKAGDRVFDIRFGWGVIDEIDENNNFYPVRVVFDGYENDYVVYTHEGRKDVLEETPLLSFTEYTLQGYSQEKPCNWEDYIGKWGKFWDNYVDEGFCVSKLNKIVFDFFYTTDDTLFNYFEPLSEEQVKILGLE